MSAAADRARAALARGDLIAAFDETISAIGEGDASADIRHQQVLALARMGDAERASDLLREYGLDRSPDPHHRAVAARLLKDRALAAGEGRQEALIAALDAYRIIFAESDDPYPGVNVAALAILAGQSKEAREIATRLIADPRVAISADYYMAATRAEALLILGRTEDCAAALTEAAGHGAADFGARSTTCRQLALLARHAGMAPEAIDTLLSPIRPPRAIHYCGHMFRADATNEARIRAVIDERLAALGVGFAYGALAAGGDILIAEAVLERGGELHVVLPFAIEDFLAQSVLPAGDGWCPRFERCMAAAASRTLASEMTYVGDAGQFAYGSRVAMGLATLRAQHLGIRPLQIAVWDGVAADETAGTGADVAAWRAHGRDAEVIAPGAIERDFVRPPARQAPGQPRALAAILFTDFPGFSKLAEAALPAFWNGVMRRVADVLEDHAGDVLCRNSWGDALYAVASSVAGAAEIALALQQRLQDFDYSTLRIAAGGMRIGVHYGPAYQAHDPITGRINFYGSEVSRAARIEPVTPPGAVFVTEPFAAILALEAPDRFRCRYVGRVALAKGYGTYPMYRLSER